MGFRSITPSINVNTGSESLRTELLNTFTRLDGQLALVPYRVATTNGPVSSSGASETDLLTTNIDTGTLAKQGSSLLIFACGTTAANGNNKTFKLKFGSATLLDTGAFAGNNISWTIQAEVVRNGATAQLTWAQFFGSATLTSKITVGTAAIDLAVQQTLKITGTGTSSGDAVANYWKVTLLT